MPETNPLRASSLKLTFLAAKANDTPSRWWLRPAGGATNAKAFAAEPQQMAERTVVSAALDDRKSFIFDCERCGGLGSSGLDRR